MLCLFIVKVKGAQQFSAGTFTWDNGTTAAWGAVTGGPYSSVWTSGNDAVFEGAAGTVSVAVAGATAHNLMFNANGFLIQNNTLTLNGTAPTIINAANTTNIITSIIAGTAGLTKTNNGTLILGGANTFTGTTTINNGELDITNWGAGTVGAISVATVNNATGTLAVVNGTLNLGANALTVGGGGTAGVVGIVNQTGGTVSFTGTSGLYDGNSSGRIGIYNLSGGTLSGFASSTRGVLLAVNSGAYGIFNLSGTGNLAIGTGALQVGRSDSTPTNCTAAYNQSGGTATVGTLIIGGGAVNTNTTATFSITNGTFLATSFPTLVGNASSSATMTLGGAAQVTVPAFPTPVGTVNLTFDFTTGYLWPNAASANYLAGLSHVYLTANGANFNVPTGNDITVAQALQDAPSQAGNLTKTGTGNLTLAGTNTYSGVTTITGYTNISSGALNVGYMDNGGVPCNLGQAANSPANLVFDGGTLNYTGNTAVSDRAFTINTGKTAIIQISTAGQSLTLPGATGAATSGSLAKIGPGTLILSGASTFSGDTSVYEGSLGLANANALQNSTLADGSVTFSQTVTGHAFSLGGLATVANIVLQDDAAIPNAVTLTVGANNADTICAGTISGSGGLIKTGSGTFTLCGKNSFSGPTVVNMGTLRLGSANLPSGINVMPMGDSITYGDHGSDAGYRGPLYNLLNPVAAGFNFVGSLTNYQANISLPPGYLHHEGHSGWTAAMLYGGNFLAPSNGVNPNVVLLQIGVNDLLTNGYTPQLQTDLENLLTQSWSNAPNANILLAEITPSIHRTGVTNYNAMVRMEVTNYLAAGKHIALVDNYSDFPPDGSADGTHPNNLGYNWMANSWYRALFSFYAASGPSLALSNSSSVTVMSGARLEGSGQIGGSLQVAGTVAPGIGGIGNLSANAATITGIYQCSINTDSLTPTPAADVINVTGALNLTGSTLVLTNLGTNMPPGGAKFTIATYATGLTGTFSGLPQGAAITNGTTAYNINYADGGGNITLTVASVAPAPAGTEFARGAFTWDTGITPAWSLTSGGPYNYSWTSGNDAVLEGTAGTVSVAAGGATANSLTFNANGYAVQNNTLTLSGPVISDGSGQTNTINSILAGTAGLNKMGVGTVNLTGANTLTGTLVVSNGVLGVANWGVSTVGAINVGYGNNNTAVLNISGGTLNLGANALTTGNSATSGQTAIVNQTGGTVSFTGGNALLHGNGAGRACTYNLSGGTLGSSFSSTTCGVMLGVNAGGNATFNLSGTGNLAMGSGALQVGRADSSQANCIVAYNQSGGTATVKTLVVGGGSGSTGTAATFNVTNGTFTATSFPALVGAASSSATMTLGGPAQVTLPAFPTPVGTANLTLDFTTGYLSPSAASTTYMSGLTHAYLTANGAKFNVALGNDITVAQALQNAPSQAGTLAKTGGGNLALTGANTYTGSTTVSAGNLEVDGAISGGGTVSVNNSASLSGNGTINGPVIVSGTLAPGLGSTIHVNNSLTLNPSGTTVMNIARNGATLANAGVQVAGALNYAGTLIVANVGNSFLQAGDTFQLFSGGSQTGSFASISFPPEYTFSNNLAVNGTIVVVSAPAPPGFNNVSATGAGGGQGTLSLTWPNNYLGWLVQSNSVNLANSNYWFDVAGSDGATNWNFPVSLGLTNCFYRMRSQSSGDFANDVLASGPVGMNVDTVWSGEQVAFSLVTLANMQIASYYNAARQLVTAARNLNSTQWYYLTNNTTFAGWDLHNYIAMSVDPTGYLHVTGNYHNQPLNYYRSVVPVTNAVQLKNPAFLPKVSPLWNSAYEQYATYPVFMTGPNQEFIFNYREHNDPSSSSGEDFLLTYNPATKSFSNPMAPNPVFAWTNIYSVYPNYYVSGGCLHALYVWRSGSGENDGGNFRLSYARTRDMTNWTDAFGRALTLPLTQYATMPIVDDIPTNSGLLNNQPQLGFDLDGVPLAAYSRFDANGYSQVYVARPVPSTLTWNIVQLTTNNYWGFIFNNVSTTNGSGSIGNSFLADDPLDGLTTVSVSMTDPYGNTDPNSGIYTFDEATLTNITGPGKDALNNESHYAPRTVSVNVDTNGVENNYVDPTTGSTMGISRTGSSGISFANLYYYLLWDALPSDRSFMPKYDPSGHLINPPPSILHLYRKAANFDAAIYGIMFKPANGNVFGAMSRSIDSARPFGQYLSSPIAGTANLAEWNFTLATGGIYLLGGSTYAPAGTNGSFYVQLDNGPLIDWHNSGYWVYQPVTAGVSGGETRFTLAAGSHTLRVYAEQPGTRVEYMWLNIQDPGKSLSLGPLTYSGFTLTNDARTVSGFSLASPAGSTPTNCTAHYEVTAAQSGDYLLLGRTKAADGNSNSFYLSVNGGPQQLWSLPISGTNWMWQAVGTNQYFSSGTISLDVYGREGGSALDSFMLFKSP